MLNQEQRMNIKQLHREGHSIKELSRISGHSRNTIRKILRGGYEEKKERKARVTKLDEYKVYVEAKFKLGRPPTRILKDIRDMGYEGGRTQFYRYLQQFRSEVKRKDKLTVRFETAPGEQAQVDWGYCGHVIDHAGRKRRLYVFAYVLSYSRICYVEFTNSMNFKTLIKCHQNAFDYCGGIPEKILYDNMKTVRLSSSELNPGFVNFADYYGICIKTCQPYRARTKGKVERLINYFKVNFLPDRKFSSMEDANSQASHWMEYEANCRVHGTTGQKPSELLKHEKLYDHRVLLPYKVVEKVSRNANYEGYVRFKGNRYSVPVEAAGKTVEVEHIGYTIKIHLKDMIIAEHNQAQGKGRTVASPEHIASMWKLTLNSSTPPESSYAPTIVFEREVESRSLSYYEEICK